ncbi:MAG: RNA polymerase sigma factor, partial [Thermoanaerobaculia bacterium]
MSAPEPEDRDAELIARSAAGDRDAVPEVVARHGAHVFRFARAIASDETAAEDALQETFLAAWRGAASFRGETSVRSWLLTIARHAVYRQHRRRSGEPEELEPLPDLGYAAGWGSVE